MADQEPGGEIVLCQTAGGRTRGECRFAGESRWLSQALMAERFQKDVRTINEHLTNLAEEGEIDPGATIRKFRTGRREGLRNVSRLTDPYNLDAILAVGHRARSPRRPRRTPPPPADKKAGTGTPTEHRPHEEANRW